MSGVRVLVGTKKGAFVLTADGKRDRWDVSGPHFAGWEMYHLKGSPADPNRLYASQTSAWFGQLIQRSNDGGKTWEPVGNQFVYDGPIGTHLWYDGTPRPWEFKRVWHLEPSLQDPDTVYAGVEDAALFRTTDGGQTWHELPGLRTHGSGAKWQPGAGGMGLHTILLDPSDPQRIYIAISAAGAFRSDDAGATWKPINSDSEHYPPEGKLRVYRSRTGGDEWEPLTKGLPQSDCYVNVLRDAMGVDSLDSCGVYFGTTGGQVYCSADSGDSWTPIVRDLPAVLSVEVQTLP